VEIINDKNSCDLIFRRAKSKAAAQGVPLRQFVTEAV
jgi:hypothetical protein